MAISFSPAGMAIKGFFGLGARTFGNPDGAKKGGGAFLAGGNNPNGPNQGGGPGGILGSANMIAGHQQHQIVHPANTSDYYGYSNGTDSFFFPLISPAMGSLSGGNAGSVVTFIALYQVASLTPGPPWLSAEYGLTLVGNLPQNAFTTLHIVGDNGPITELSAAASSYGVGGAPVTTNWTWTIVPPAASDFTSGNPYTLTLS